MSDGYLESSLLGTDSALRESWAAVRRTYASGTAPSDDDLLRHVRAHVVGLLVSGRAAEFSRFMRTVERLLGEADPVLHDLLDRELLHPLARELDEVKVPRNLIMPHLGPRSRSSLGETRPP